MYIIHIKHQDLVSTVFSAPQFIHEKNNFNETSKDLPKYLNIDSIISII